VSDKKIIIITEAGQNYGFGHIVRCKALYDVFESFGLLPTIIIKGDSAVESIIANTRHIMFDWHSDILQLIQICNDTDICVVDSYHASIDIYYHLSVISKKLVVFDDYNRLEYPPQTYIINGLLNVDSGIYQNQQKATVLAGIEYQCVRSIFWNLPEKKIQKKIHKVMITVGANDIRNIIPIITKNTLNVYQEAEIHIVVSSTSGNIELIQSLKKLGNILIHINPNEQELLEIMQECDFAISASGQTLCELACCGIPGISISVIDNQLEHAKSWDALECFDIAGVWDEVDFEKRLIQRLEKIEDYEYRLYHSRKLQSIITGNGAKKIVESLL